LIQCILQNFDDRGIDQIALAYRFKAKDKAASAFDRSFLPQAAERSFGDAASR